MFSKDGAFTYLCVLTWYFNLIDFAVLEFSQVVTEQRKWLEAGSTVDDFLELVSPVLQALDVLCVGWFAADEVFLVLLLQ